MVSSLIILTAVAAVGEVELLHFSAPWCSGCKESEPAVRQLEATGFPIRHFNTDTNRELARRFGVRTIPSFVMVSQGKIVDRIDGAVSYQDLSRLVRKHRSSRGEKSRPSRMTRGSSHRKSDVAVNTPESEAFNSSVRLIIQDNAGQSFGTGTIVDVHGKEALVLTCGHIFRDSGGRGDIQVDIFSDNRLASSVKGRLLRHDLKLDLALVSIRPDVPVTAVQIANTVRQIDSNSEVFSVGCDQGRDPSLLRGRVKAVDKYLGPSNVVVSGLPIDGRSGGGLFSRDGQLIGVCQAADPEYNEGIYGFLPAIHDYLDRANLAFIYNRTATQEQLVDHGNGARRRSTPPRIQNSDIGLAQFNETRNENASRQLPALKTLGSDTEVVCIVRSKDNPKGPSRVVVLDRPSKDFLRQLSREQQSQDRRQMTNLRINK